MAEYHSVIRDAVAKLDPNTVDARDDIYRRARQAMFNRLRSLDPPLPIAVIDAELEEFDQDVERVEAEHRSIVDGVGSSAVAPGPGRRIIGPLMTVVAVAGVVIAVGLTAIIFGPRLRREPQAAQIASAPGVSYVYLRQPVYYRTTEPVGTILIDKSQGFVYIVLPNVTALRYGMGIGPECTTAAGLYRVARKEQWPGRSTSALGQFRSLIGEDPADNPLGPRALYFGTEYRLHGTNAPLGIGGSMPIGCFALLNDSIVEFYDKAPIETRIVVMN